MGQVFGHVTDHWQRIEFQNGDLHIHMLLWVDNSESKEGKVSAELVVLREVGDVNLRRMVLKYQNHSCRTGRCFKIDAKHTLCKYGFPNALLKDGLDESGDSKVRMPR